MINFDTTNCDVTNTRQEIDNPSIIRSEEMRVVHSTQVLASTLERRNYCSPALFVKRPFFSLGREKLLKPHSIDRVQILTSLFLSNIKRQNFFFCRAFLRTPELAG